MVDQSWPSTFIISLLVSLPPVSLMYSFLVYSLAWSYLLYKYSICCQRLLGHTHHSALTPHLLLSSFAKEVKVRGLFHTLIKVLFLVTCQCNNGHKIIMANPARSATTPLTTWLRPFAASTTRTTGSAGGAAAWPCSRSGWLSAKLWLFGRHAY